MTTYISGPMSGIALNNFPTFHAAAARLRAQGRVVINPAELDAQDTAPKEWHEYMRRDIVELMKCDTICMLPGWEDSKGARLELRIARELGMRVEMLPGQTLEAHP